MAAKGAIFLPIVYKDDPKGLKEAEKRLKKFGQNVGRVAAAGFAVAGLAALKFGFDSVRAFAEAEKAQLELQFAFEKFPKLADTNVDALNRLNQALMKKTRFDDDAISSAQGLLASFQLTGKQVEELTPLLLDYAARTGRDLPSAAAALGKAMLGQGRALKEVGIDFEDTGSLAGNFDQIIAGLREQVGGFAEQDGATAAGRLEILRNRFGEVQEVVGEALMPALEKLLDWLEGDGLAAIEQFGDWFATDGIKAIDAFVDSISRMSEDGSLVPNIVAGLGAITAAQLTLNAAMAANPVGLVIAALVALGSYFIWLGANFETATSWIHDAADNVIIALARAQIWMNGLTEGFVNNIIGMINAVMGPINAVRSALGLPVQIVPAFRIDNSGLRSAINQSLTNIVTARPGGGGGTADRRMARGGLVVGPTNALIGEGGPEVVAPYDKFVETMGMARGGGSSITINVNAGMGTDGVAVGREIVKAIKRYERASGPVFVGA